MCAWTAHIVYTKLQNYMHNKWLFLLVPHIWWTLLKTIAKNYLRATMRKACSQSESEREREWVSGNQTKIAPLKVTYVLNFPHQTKSNCSNKKYGCNTREKRTHTQRESERPSDQMYIDFYCYVFYSKQPSIVSIACHVYGIQVVYLVVKTTMHLSSIQ